MIRRAASKDFEALARLSGELGYPMSGADMRARLVDLLGRDDHAVLVADVGGEVAGWIHVIERRSLEGGVYAEIGGLVVDEKHRGQKLGEALTTAAEEWGRKRGLKRMRVRSNVIRERAHAFYKRLGYVVSKTQAVFHKPL